MRKSVISRWLQKSQLLSVINCIHRQMIDEKMHGYYWYFVGVFLC